MPACGVAIDFPGYHPRSCHRCHCWIKTWSCRSGILENGHHVAWGLAAVAAAAPVPDPKDALGAVPTPCPVAALEAVPTHPTGSPAGAAAVAASAVVVGAAVLVVIWGRHDGRWI